MNVVDRALPHNLDAERAVLGAMILVNETWHDVAARLENNDFFRDAHQRIFKALRRLQEQGLGMDFVTLSNELQKTGELEEIGGPIYLTSLTDGMPRSTNVISYCVIIKEKARLRRLIYLNNKLLASAYEGDEAASALVETGVKELFALADAGGPDGSVAAQAAVNTYMSALSAGTVLDALPTGYLDVDDLIGGLNRSELSIIAARPSVGKSTLALGIAERMASKGTGVAFFSLEMRHETLAAQLLAWRAKVSAFQVRRRRATDAEYQRLGEAWATMPDIPLYFQSARGLTEILAWCRRLRQDKGVLVAVIDYIQLLSGEGKYESRQAEVANLSRTLKRLAEDEQLAVVGLSQLKRRDDQKGKKLDRRPQLSDLRESGALEQDADMAILLYRPEMDHATEDNRGITEVIVAKNRTGPTGVKRLYFNATLAQFADLRAD